MKAIALFDFDGTISNKDSMLGFICYAVGYRSFAWGLLRLLPMLLAYVTKRIENHSAKEQLLSYFFKGWTKSHFNTVASRYSLEQLPKMIRAGAAEKITWHQSQGHQVVVVSASIDSWLQCWCDKHRIKLIATRIEIIHGVLTGKLLGQNCHGPEKVKRVKAVYNLSEYDVIYAYGDTSGDSQMLDIADQRYFKPFR
jgi:HAD superfamily hydrolase (TIGR01490 family)